MSTSTIHGPGILFVRSRISPSANDLLTEPVFLAWYDDEHIPEVVSTSSIHSAMRYIDVHKSSPIGDSQNPKPFLACYPMGDLAFTLGDEFKKIGFRSSKLPGSGVIYDLADMDVSYLGFMGATKRTREFTGGEQKFIITLGVRPEKKIAEGEIAEFFQKQTRIIEQTPQYIRSVRFKLLYARTNAQSRALKGLPTTDEPHPEPSTWLAMHEFAELPGEELIKTLNGSAKKAAEEEEWGATEIEMLVWRLDRAHGDEKFFDE
ncbi:hypothetical protein CC77DRAFT_702321 [Alternaria alternata]|uniref:Uncharacterized protein n=2 Tax=Alternaria alternata complex TaxID=187734 RepID=A0A177DU18_ALTAL|nr:hypothetical protein CC77DRAFT_702321 [Alternaria alternata]XP_051590354.1 uncharacterized protein J4E82_003746 [Alternaria postmessia]RII04538.1 hypothetical protein CUC08_Gglean010786 [Alternaria sp. MG1]RYN16182.1 hypothetical protein AA0115_g12512 [Alternaria tenuissima]KAI5377651.1 hypothetical protein J4E82_003746 [Alternaria postmessia]OAG23225.1 hypothetical protein CC77DRAFT_702321 [Alternaria alternata]RYN64962.1 hypothetical protein AA0117_g12307 [Alternaria alternata]